MVDWFAALRDRCREPAPADGGYVIDSVRLAETAFLAAVPARPGLFLISGDPGSGRSTLCRRLARRLDEAGYHVGVVSGAEIGDSDGMIETLRSAGDSAGLSERDAVLIVDDAEMLPDGVLRALPDVVEQTPLRRIVLAGSRQLEHSVGQLSASQQAPDMRSGRDLRRYVAAYWRLAPLKEAEIAPLLAARFQAAGCPLTSIFAPGALEVLAFHSGGNPGRVLSLTHAALQQVSSARELPIGPADVQAAALAVAPYPFRVRSRGAASQALRRPEAASPAAFPGARGQVWSAPLGPPSDARSSAGAGPRRTAPWVAFAAGLLLGLVILAILTVQSWLPMAVETQAVAVADVQEAPQSGNVVPFTRGMPEPVTPAAPPESVPATGSSTPSVGPPAVESPLTDSPSTEADAAGGSADPEPPLAASAPPMPAGPTEAAPRPPLPMDRPSDEPPQEKVAEAPALVPAAPPSPRNGRSNRETAASPAATEAAPLRVVIHFSTRNPNSELAARQLAQQLTEAGVPVSALVPKDIAIATTRLRYFFPEDRDGTETRVEEQVLSVLDSFGVREAGHVIQDYTSYEPKPRRGTVEVWLVSSGG